MKLIIDEIFISECKNGNHPSGNKVTILGILLVLEIVTSIDGDQPWDDDSPSVLGMVTILGL